MVLDLEIQVAHYPCHQRRIGVDIDAVANCILIPSRIRRLRNNVRERVRQRKVAEQIDYVPEIAQNEQRVCRQRIVSRSRIKDRRQNNVA